MIRNHSQDRHSHILVHSPETKKHSSHLTMQENPPIYCIEKSRAMSHKKLSITSSPANDERSKERPQVRFTQPGSGEMSRFYKNPSKPALLLQSKKPTNFEEVKVSLKTSNYGFQPKEVSSRDNSQEVEQLKK